MRPSAVSWVIALYGAAWLGGCMADDPVNTDHLSVLAVRADPPTGAPGRTLSFSLLDSEQVAPPAEGARPLQTAWLGGCHNPPGRQYFGCYPGLKSAVAGLEPRVVDTSPARLAQAGAGLGPTFAEVIPEDIVQAGFGVSYVFFAVCAGELTAAPGVDNTVPLGCHDPSGRAIGRAGFAVGFTTVYTIPGVTNSNPLIDGVDLDGEPLDELACAVDADCPSGGTLAWRCREPGPGIAAQCLPVLEPCSASPWHELVPRLDPASAEPNPLAAAPGGSPPRETLELSLFGAGPVGITRTVRGDGTRWLDDLGFALGGAPAGSPGVVWWWLIARDGRGGVTWTKRALVAESGG